MSTYRGVSSVYKDARFSTRAYTGTLEAIHGRTVLSMDGLLHAKNRALLTPHFRGQGLDRVHALIHRTARQDPGADRPAPRPAAGRRDARQRGRLARRPRGGVRASVPDRGDRRHARAAGVRPRAVRGVVRQDHGVRQQPLRRRGGAPSGPPGQGGPG
ncbi:hypothetical protein ACFSTC_62590 [Nonomuraea ferruginea]